MFIGQQGDFWPDINIMQMVKNNNKMASFVVKVLQVPDLSYNDMFIGQQGDFWPDINIMQMVKHNNEMASFVVKVLQPLSVLRC